MYKSSIIEHIFVQHNTKIHTDTHIDKIICKERVMGQTHFVPERIAFRNSGSSA